MSVQIASLQTIDDAAVNPHFVDGHRYGMKAQSGYDNAQSFADVLTIASGVSGISGGMGHAVLRAGTFEFAADPTIVTPGLIIVEGQGPGKTILKGPATMNALGVKSGTFSDLQATMERFETKIRIANGGGANFAVGDWVLIEGSPNEANNSTKGNQQELNMVIAIDNTPGTYDELTFRWPILQRYPLDGFLTKPRVTKMTSVLQKVIFRGLTFDRISLPVGGVYGFIMEDVEIMTSDPSVWRGLTYTGAALGSRDVTLHRVEMKHTIAPTSTESFLGGLYGVSHGILDDVRFYGGKEDHFRFFAGCSDIVCDRIVSDKAASRALWFYQGSKVNVERSQLNDNAWGQIDGTNIETLLLDFIYNARIRDVDFNRIRTIDMLELRARAEEVRVEDCDFIPFGGFSGVINAVHIHADQAPPAKGIWLVRNRVILPADVTRPVNFPRLGEPVSDLHVIDNEGILVNQATQSLNFAFSIQNLGADCERWTIRGNHIMRGLTTVGIFNPGFLIKELHYEFNTIVGDPGTGSDMVMADVSGGTVIGNKHKSGGSRSTDLSDAQNAGLIVVGNEFGGNGASIKQAAADQVGHNKGTITYIP